MNEPDIRVFVQEEQEKILAEQANSKRVNGSANSLHRQFATLGDDHYCLYVRSLAVPDKAIIELDVDRLRRTAHELWGELCVRCELSGVRTVDGTVSIADFNLSSARARIDRAKLLASRANIRDLDWQSLVEEFCQRVLQADRLGQLAVDLRTIPVPTDDDAIKVEGLYLLRRHPVVLFGDSGAAKSYLGLYLAGRLAECGLSVALFDWELAGEDHRVRLGRLFADGMPRIMYARCERPLAFEADRIRRIVRDDSIEFAVFDSVAFACDGPPEAAEVAGRYFRAVRGIGIGSLHIAHISKSENADQRPFGSAFWHNGARATWFCQKADESPEGETLQIGLFNRKANLGRLRQPIGYRITFSDEQTIFQRTDVADNPDLAERLTIRQRMGAMLRKGAKTPAEIAEEVRGKIETIERTARRYPNQFLIIPGGKIGLLDKGAL